MMNKSSGFTLIELILVVGLIVVFAAISLPITLSFYNNQVLEETANSFRNNLSKVRTWSMTGKGEGFWGIRFEQNRYILFEGENYESRNKVADLPIPLPYGITFESYNREIVFERDTGKPFYDPSLVGHWKMQAGKECTAYDYSGYNNHGELKPDCPTSSPSWAEDRDGVAGQALSFNGSSDYVQLPETENVLSISIWVNIPSPQSGWRYLLDARTGGANGWFAQSSDGVSSVGGLWTNGKMYVNGESQTVSFNSIPRNQWAHLYLEAGTLFTDDINLMSRYTNNEFLGGSIDEVGIWNRALTEYEIQALYQGENKITFKASRAEDLTLTIDEQGNVNR